MLTGYLGTLPADTLLDAGVLFVLQSGVAVPIGVTDGAPDFDPGVEEGDIMFDNRAPSRLKGLARRVQFKPVIKGTLKEFGPAASGNQIALLEPGVSEGIAGGTTTETVKSAGSLYAAGSYITDFRLAFERGSGGYACIYFPLAIVRKWSAKGNDKKEAAIAFEIEAIGDPVNDLSSAPYAIEIRTSMPVSEATFLASAIIGGNSSILAAYSARSGTTIASNELTQWDDLRGAVGFGPSLVRIGGAGTGLSVIGADSSSWYFRTDSARTMQTALSSKFNLSSAKCLVVIGSVSQAEFGTTTDSFSAVGIMPVVPNNGRIQLSGWISGVDVGVPAREGLYGVQLNKSDAAGIRYGARVKSWKRRLQIVGMDGTNAHARSAPLGDVSNTFAGLGASANALLFVGGYDFGSGLQWSDETVRAVLVLDHIPSAQEVANLTVWHETYHVARSKAVLFDGDSITYGLSGTGMVSYRDAYPYVVMERPTYEGYADENVAISGASFGADPSTLGGVQPYYGSLSIPTHETALYSMYPNARRLIHLLGGTNDILFIGAGSAATIETAITSYVANAHSQGIAVALGTHPPRHFSDTAGVQTACEAERQALNTWIRGTGAGLAGVAFIADYDANAGLITPTTNAGNADYVDGTHLTSQGHLKMANVLDPLLRTYFGETQDVIVSSDDFNRAPDGTHPGSDAQAHPWVTVGGGSWGINTNQAFTSGGGSSNIGGIILNVGVSDGTAQVTWATLPAAFGSRLLLRMDATGQNGLFIEGGTTETITLYKLAASVNSVLVTSPGIKPQSGDIITAWCKADRIVVWLTRANSTTRVLQAFTTWQQSGTYFGMGTEDGNTDARFDNWQFKTP